MGSNRNDSPRKGEENRSWHPGGTFATFEATRAVLESVCDVDVAYGGGEALDKARAARPDLILLDVIMPDEDGFAVCEKQGRPGAGRCAGDDADQSARWPQPDGPGEPLAAGGGLHGKARQAGRVVEAGEQVSVPASRGRLTSALLPFERQAGSNRAKGDGTGQESVGQHTALGGKIIRLWIHLKFGMRLRSSIWIPEPKFGDHQ